MADPLPTGCTANAKFTDADLDVVVDNAVQGVRASRERRELLEDRVYAAYPGAMVEAMQSHIVSLNTIIHDHLELIGRLIEAVEGRNKS